MSRLYPGDYVRPNSPSLGLPIDSIWFVRTSLASDAIRIEPVAGTSSEAISADTWRGRNFSKSNFDKLVRVRGGWVDVRDADFLHAPDSFYDDVLPGRMSSSFPSPQNIPQPMLTSADAVTTATVAAEQASNATAAIDRQLKAARKLEAERQEELRAAKAAKAKADKVAAARAKVEEARRALSAKLHADRCLGEATLDLIAEVSRLNNGGPEKTAAASIAAHVEQLQPLARSYGYRITKPSMIALVIPL